MDKDDIKIMILEMLLQHRPEIQAEEAGRVAIKLYNELREETVNPSRRSPSSH